MTINNNPEEQVQGSSKGKLIVKILEWTGAAITVTGTFLLALSCVHLHQYYNSGFGIPIHNYIGFSELLIALLPFTFMLGLVILLALAMVGLYLIVKSQSKDFLFYPPFFGLIFIIAFTFGFWIIQVVSRSIVNLYQNITMVTFVSFTVLLIASSLVYFLYRNGKFSLSISVAIVLLFCFASISYITGEQINNIKSEHPPLAVKITFENNLSLSTSDTLIYVGMTEKYLFLLKPASDRTRVIKREDIKELEFWRLKYP